MTISPEDMRIIDKFGERYSATIEVGLALNSADTVAEAAHSLCVAADEDLHRTCQALNIEVPDAEDPEFYENLDRYSDQVPLTVETMMAWALSFEN